MYDWSIKQKEKAAQQQAQQMMNMNAVNMNMSTTATTNAPIQATANNIIGPSRSQQRLISMVQRRQ